MDIKVKEQEQNRLVFIVNDVDVSFINAIRRICMMEVPTMAIDDINLIKNDSAMFDEVLAHRLGLIPLISDNKYIEGLDMPNECECEDGCNKCSTSFILEKKGPTIVYSKDLISQDPNIKPVYDTIPIVKLRENEEIELEAIAQLGIGLEHAKWEPTVACAYKFYPNITINEGYTNGQEYADACPRNVLTYNKKTEKVEINDIENCSLCKTCYRVCEPKTIDIGYIENKFIFTIETDGSKQPKEVLLEACDILSRKTDEIINIV